MKIEPAKKQRYIGLMTSSVVVIALSSQLRYTDTIWSIVILVGIGLSLRLIYRDICAIKSERATKILYRSRSFDWGEFLKHKVCPLLIGALLLAAGAFMVWASANVFAWAYGHDLIYASLSALYCAAVITFLFGALLVTLGFLLVVKPDTLW